MKINQKTIIIKRVCALLLLISFFLPLARGCSKIEGPYQKDGVTQEKKKPFFSIEVKEPKTKYAYDIMALEEVTTSSALLFLFFGYLWPIPVLLLHQFTRKKIFKYVLACSELCFCVLTVYLILISVVFEGEMLAGGYLAITSGIVYFCTAAFELFKGIHTYFKERKW